MADLADRLTLAPFRSRSFTVEHKPDLSEVTEIDRDAETAIRNHLSALRPDDAVLGEEHGAEAGRSAWRWIIDPIDGTANYVRGVPIWATLVAAEHEGVLQVGLVSAPALGRRWWATRSGGAFVDGRSMHVSAVTRLADAHLSYTNVGDFYDYGRGDQLVALSRQVWRARGLGDFWMHMLVAEGAFDIACEPVVNLWDVAAIQLIVEEAGGRFTDLSGVARPDGGDALSTNGHLHDEVLAILAG
ncbi:MAG: histidinol-phosphatase [Acidimicrobiaceae bacterium]|nr:histidinol-phosphatase [Acidimicrobiaceae bacterium]